MATQIAVREETATKRSSQTGDTVARLLTLVFAALVLLIAVILVFELWKGSGPLGTS